MNIARTITANILVVSMTGVALADYPPLLSNTEMQPPTAEDEAWRSWRRLQRCHHCLEPIAIPQTVVYYPCAPGHQCGKAIHPSYRGSYGSIHPAPYYLPTPKIAVIDTTLCAQCKGRANHAVEILTADDATHVIPAVEGLSEAIESPSIETSNPPAVDESVELILPEDEIDLKD